MAGLGFVLFILPPLLGIVIGVVLCFMHRLRFLASYAVGIPVLGALGGWIGLDLGSSSSLTRSYMYGLSQSWLSAHFTLLAFLAGYGLGISAGILAGSWMNRLTRLVSS
jgi:hypothetical protein